MHLRLKGAAVAPDRPLVELPLVSWNVPTVADTLQDLEAHDQAGSLTLTAHDTGTGSETLRQWFASRATRGEVSLSYTVRPPRADAPRGAAPPVDLRAEAGALSGGATIVLLRPAIERARFNIDWELSALPAGSSAALSPLPEGEGREVKLLDQIYFMTGALRRYPDSPPGQGFYSAWQGDPPFDARSLMQWTGELYGHYEKFFGTPAAPYTVFMRRNPVNAGGGMGMHRSFIVTFGDNGGNDPQELKFTLAHEMFHTFQPMLSASKEQGGELAASWFNEGLAVFYEHELPFRYGLIDANAFLKDVNFYAARYYTNALGNVPNSQVPARFWADTRIRTLPYDRGFLYFVTMDEAMRHASHGRRSLDDLMLAMKALERSSGRPLVARDWTDLLRRELGSTAVQAFERSLAGDTPLPSSGAFGSCYRRISKPLRRYELGFEPAVLTESPRIVRGLLPGSAAQAAGLRNGDEILRPVPQDKIQGTQDEWLHLAIRRGDAKLDISYLPRGETVPTWQWERIRPGGAARCGR
ncbi:MAG: peptidase M61 [Proteobacteria bacterium]|nr:peptidase M61 [Pseudomonadota bacterium]